MPHATFSCNAAQFAGMRAAAAAHDITVSDGNSGQLTASEGILGKLVVNYTWDGQSKLDIEIVQTPAFVSDQDVIEQIEKYLAG